MPPEGVTKKSHGDILSVEEISEIVSAAAKCGITKVRVTGGEPLIRRGILDICAAVTKTPGIAETCVTTNGTLLRKFALPLRQSGVSRLNISLDTLDPDVYREITRGGELRDAIDGIRAARDAGFDAIKINAVLIGGVNDAGVRDMVELTRDNNISVRFIELMPMGECAQWSRERFISGAEILRALPELESLDADGVARLYRLPGAKGTVGVISPISAHFCASCNRVRVTADGKIKPCLHSADETNLRGLHGDELVSAISAAIYAKPKRHTIDGGNISGSARNMNAIGG
jgi:cyclic pyranopterin phosphate synthase